MTSGASRRDFLRQALGGGVALRQALLSAATTSLAACSGEALPATAVDDGGSTASMPRSASNSGLEGGELLEVVPFVEEEGPFDTKVGRGWDARIYTDLSSLDRDSLIVDNDRFYVRTEYPDQLDPSAPWVVEIGGLVEASTALPIEELLADSRDMGVHVLECSGNGRSRGFGLLSAAQWGGVPLHEVLERVTPMANGSRVLVGGFDEHSTPSARGHSTPGAEWIFTLDQLSNAGAFLATEMNGDLLPPDHGAPVRLFVPGWYGCTCIKWVNRIDIVGDDAPATSQMLEFAGRTHQPEAFARARDYLPATVDQAAMPVRVEKWRLTDGELVYRVVGVMWGGYQLTDALEVSFGGGAWEPVAVEPPQTTNETWTLWEHVWRAGATGRVAIVNRIADPDIPTLRLDAGFYLREIDIDEI